MNNLQDIINYRNKCLICQSPMQMIVADYSNLKIVIKTNGLLIHSGHSKGIKILFKYDSTIERNEKEYSLYGNNIKIIKTCPICPIDSLPKAGFFILKPRSIGHSTMNEAITLNNMKKSSCFYTMLFHLNNEENIKQYSVSMDDEVIKFSNEKEVWSIRTDFSLFQETTINHILLKNKLEDMVTLRVPIINSSKIKNINELIQKLQLYILFS